MSMHDMEHAQYTLPWGKCFCSTKTLSGESVCSACSSTNHKRGSIDKKMIDKAYKSFYFVKVREQLPNEVIAFEGKNVSFAIFS